MAEMDAFETHAYSMKTIHTVLGRSLDQLLKPVESETPLEQKQLKDYLGFLTAYMELLHGHHAIEEQVIFPEFKKMGIDMDAQAEEHKTAEKLMADLDAIAKNKDLAQFDKVACKEKLTSLKTLMEPHFKAEEDAINADAMQKAGFTVKQTKDLDKRIVKMAMKEDDTLILPLIYYHLDQEQRLKFWNVTFPWILRKLIFPLFISKVHKSYWQYALYKP